MADKATYQHGGTSDGKTFTAPREVSPPFGVLADDEKLYPGSTPGSKQVPAPLFSPENG